MSQDNEHKPFDAPTPQVGTPSFEELDASVGEVPLVGPTPDRAADYAAPRPLPKVSDHRTMEIETVKVKPQEDPRKALTIKNIRTLPREAPPAPAVGATRNTRSSSVAPAVQSTKQPLATARTGGIAVALIAGVLLMVVIVLMSSTKPPPPEPTMGKVDLAAAPTLQPAADPLATPAETASAAASQAKAEAPAPAAAVKVAPAAKPAVAKPPKPEPVATEKPEAKPIFNTEGDKPNPKPVKPAAEPKPLFE